MPASIKDVIRLFEIQGNSETKADELTQQAARLESGLIRDATALAGDMEIIAAMRIGAESFVAHKL